MYCKKCGAKLKATDKYCSQCASPVEEDGVGEAQDSDFLLDENAQPLRPKSYSERIADGTLQGASVTEPEQLNSVRFGTDEGLEDHEILYPGEQFDRMKLYDDRLYRDSFVDKPEEGGHALLTTVLILLLIVVLSAAFLIGYFIFRKSSNDPSTAQTTVISGEEADAQDQEGVVVIVSDDADSAKSTEASDAAAGDAQDAGDAADAAAQPDQTAAGETAATEKETQAPAPVSAGPDMAHLEEILATQSTAQTASVYVYDLLGGKEYAGTNSGEKMFTSATLSVPILYTAAAMLDGGQLTLNDQITYVNSIGGRGEANPESRDGKPYPLSYYLTTMLKYSDNNCMNCLIDRISLAQINDVCHNAGYESVDVQRSIVADVTDGKENYVSARDLALMVKELYNGKFKIIGRDFMTQFFRVDEGDEGRTVLGNAAVIPENAVFLNQNGRGDTRYSEVAVVADETHAYVIALMLRGDYGFTYEDAAVQASAYVYESLTP